MWCHEVIGKGRWFKKAVRRNTNFHFRLKVWSLCVALEQRSIWDNLIFSFLSQNLQVLFVATMYIQSCRAIWPFDYYCNSLFPFFVLEYYWLSYHKVWATLLYLSHVVQAIPMTYIKYLHLGWHRVVISKPLKFMKQIWIFRTQFCLLY